MELCERYYWNFHYQVRITVGLVRKASGNNTDVAHIISSLLFIIKEYIKQDMKCPVTEWHELACETTLKIFNIILKGLDDPKILR